jgi:hypothetical protein
MTEAALLKKKPLPDDFLANDVIYEIDILVSGGAQARVQTTDRDLYNEILTELKGIGMFHRQPVRTWESREHAAPVKTKKVKPQEPTANE